jgi:translation initiation factor 4G
MGPPPKIVAGEKRGKPAALNLAPLNTKPVEAPQPSAALQSLKSARFLTVLNSSIYPPNISSPNPALNSAVAAKGKSFKYDKEFLMQFQKVFTEKPSMEFESQIKALIGDSEPGSARIGSQRGGAGGSLGARSNSNRNAPGAFAMGNFGAVGGGKTLPPGTTSADRFAMSQGTMARPNAPSPMASFGRAGGAFPNAGSISRSASSQNIGGPNSPRNTSNRNSTRQNQSKRDGNFKGSKEDEKKMPLTAGQDLKPIQVTSSGWKPRSLQAQSSATGAAGPAPGSSGASGHMEPDMVQRKVKAALNKMTPEKFDKIADQILAIAAQSKDEADGRTLRQVIQLTFEKATDEAHWASMYAKFCKRMLETMSSDIKDESITDKNGNVVSGGNLFRKYLLNRCQEEFERGWKMDLGDKPEGDENEAKTEEAAMLSEGYYIAAAAKRRGLGLVQFIGELYKLGMLTERIMHECVKKLVDYTGIPDEAEIESLTKLLKTIGGNLDSTEKGKPMMDVYFGRIQSMIDTPDLPSRLRFMLMDIIDLRKKRWVSKEDNKGPKTLEEVRAEVCCTFII